MTAQSPRYEVFFQGWRRTNSVSFRNRFKAFRRDAPRFLWVSHHLIARIRSGAGGGCRGVTGFLQRSSTPLRFRSAAYEAGKSHRSRPGLLPDFPRGVPALVLPACRPRHCFVSSGWQALRGHRPLLGPDSDVMQLGRSSRPVSETRLQ